MKPRVVLVAAVADNGVIGCDGKLPWHLPEDLAHFKRLTTGHAVLMGRRTFESIGRPLPSRLNIVLTRQRDWTADGVLVAHDLDEALTLAGRDHDTVMVIGGAEVYAQAMDGADEQVLTEVHRTVEGDAVYPDVDPEVWQETSREPYAEFDVVRWERRRPPGG